MPEPPSKVRMIHATRTRVGSQPRYSAMPPQTPASWRFWRERQRRFSMQADPIERRSVARAQPLVDRRRHLALGAAGDVDADVAALERQLGVVGAARAARQRARGVRRHQMVLLGVDVEDRQFELAQIHFATADDEAALHQLVALVEILDELAEGLAGLVGRVEDPALHAQEVL